MSDQNLDILINIILKGGSQAEAALKQVTAAANNGSKEAAAVLQKVEAASKGKAAATEEEAAALSNLSPATQKYIEKLKESTHHQDELKSSLKGVAHEFPGLNLLVHAFRHPILLAGAAIGGLIAKTLELRAEMHAHKVEMAATARAYDMLRSNVEAVADIAAREKESLASRIENLHALTDAVGKFTEAIDANSAALVANQIINSKFDDQILHAKLAEIDASNDTPSNKNLRKANAAREHEQAAAAQGVADKRAQADADAAAAEEARKKSFNKEFEAGVDSANIPDLKRDVQDAQAALDVANKNAEKIPEFEKRIAELTVQADSGKGIGGIGGKTAAEAREEADRLKAQVQELRDAQRAAAGDDEGTIGLTGSKKALADAQARRDKDLADAEAFKKRQADLEASAAKKRAEADILDRDRTGPGAMKAAIDEREARQRRTVEARGEEQQVIEQLKRQRDALTKILNSVGGWTDENLALMEKIIAQLNFLTRKQGNSAGRITSDGQ